MPSIIACCRLSTRELDIFRLWVQHYKPFVDQIMALCVIEQNDDPSKVERFCSDNQVNYQLWRAEHFDPRTSMVSLQAFVRNIKADWLIHADSDEFLREIVNIRAIISAMDAANADHAVAWMADRLALDGTLRKIDDIDSVAELERVFPVRAAVTQKLARACSYKVCLSRWPFTGLIHNPGPALRVRAKKRLTLEHFKWRYGLEERLQKRIRDHRASRLPWGHESERIFKELETFGRIRPEKWKVL